MAATERQARDVFRLEAKGLRAGNVVGMVSAGGVTVEILPKVSSGSSVRADARFLMDLLATSGLAPRLVTRAGDVVLHRAELLEAIVRAFVDDLTARLISGFPRRYSERREDSEVLRGRIDFSRLVTRRPAMDHLLPVRYSPLQSDNPVSQLLRAAVHALIGYTRSARSRAGLAFCRQLLSDVTVEPLSPALARRVQLTRYEEEWAPAVELARALAEGRAPTPVESGDTPSFTLLFSLDDLFEGVLRLRLPAILASSGVALAKRRNLRLLMSRVSGHEALQLRPDYVFSGAGGEKVLVGDAKWKRLSNTPPTFGLNPGDMYQLTTYMARHGLDRGVLMFPMDDWMRDGGDLWMHQFDLMGGGGRVALLAIDVPELVSRQRDRRTIAEASIRAAISSILLTSESASNGA